MGFGDLERSVSPNSFFPHFESRAKLHKAAEGMDGQMEKKGICVFNRWREEGGRGKGEEGQWWSSGSG